MPAFDYFSEELLQPISVDKPSGTDLGDDLLFADVREARRADEKLNAGDWARRDGPKVANWDVVAKLCLGALRMRTKDLRLAANLTEAALHLDGLEGFCQGLRLCRELMVQFWDKGLFPPVEAGDLYDRASGLSLINNPLPDAIRQLPLTSRVGENYSLVHYKQAELVGSDASYASASAQRRDTVDELRKQGYVSMDSFDAAVKATGLKEYEELFAQFEAVGKELGALSKAADEKFGEADAPSFSSARNVLKDIRGVLEPILQKKRAAAEIEKPVSATGGAAAPVIIETPRRPESGRGGALLDGLPADQSAAWAEAEVMVRAGQVDKGLASMAALAAHEGSARARFLRKLMLVDVCLSVKRERLAKTILQELKEQITIYKLDQWESSALVGAVWSRLYRVYRKSESEAEQEQAAKLYTQLCQLDPWQAYLHCED